MQEIPSAHLYNQRRDSLSLRLCITVKIHRFSIFRVQKRRQICEFSLDAAHRPECDIPRPDSEGSTEEAKSIRNREGRVSAVCPSSKCLERFCGEVDGGGRLTSNDVRNSNHSIPSAASLHAFCYSCFTTRTFHPYTDYSSFWSTSQAFQSVRSSN